MKPIADIDSSQLAARMNAAEQYVRQGDIANATHIVETLASEVPQFWWIWEKLGELKARANRFAEDPLFARGAVF